MRKRSGRAVKKPIEIEFVIFDTDEWVKDGKSYEMVYKKYKHPVTSFGNVPVIPTLEGNMEVSDGDYIIKGVEGEYYPCKPEIFLKTYDIILDK